MEPELRKELKQVEAEIRKTRKAIDGTWYATFVRGLIYGSGFVIGSALAIAAGSWLLSQFGVVPGLGELFLHLRDILQTRTSF